MSTVSNKTFEAFLVLGCGCAIEVTACFLVVLKVFFIKDPDSYALGAVFSGLGVTIIVLGTSLLNAARKDARRELERDAAQT